MPASNQSKPAGRLPRMQQLTVSRCFVLALIAAYLFCFADSRLSAQDTNPLANDPKASKLGEFQFRSNCAFCHGLGARGGGRGPDLTRAQKRHGNSDADLFRTINEGVPGTAMPPNGATQQGVGMTETEIWQVIAYIRSVQVKAPAQPLGDAAHGKTLFFGERVLLHLPHGGREGRPAGPGPHHDRFGPRYGLPCRFRAQSQPAASAGHFRSNERIFAGI